MMFKVGDRVEAIVDHIERNRDLLKGDTGTVCAVHGENGMFGIGVEWDRVCGGHDCGVVLCEYGHGWNVNIKDIRLIEKAFCVHDIEVDSSDLLALFGGACHV